MYFVSATEKIQKNLDESGISEGITYYVGAATEQTKNIGSQIYEKGGEAYAKANENEYVNQFTEKSKVVIGTVGS